MGTEKIVCFSCFLFLGSLSEGLERIVFIIINNKKMKCILHLESCE